MTYSYLALGDSYTIGEQVAVKDNFPNQTKSILDNQFNININPLDIIATTGWTTDELALAIEHKNINHTYDFVSLLIGVNNQYRGRSIKNYTEEFTDLLNQAIRFAQGNNKHVFVLSIPDWGITPFAEGKDRIQITKEIDAYNEQNLAITLEYQCNYIDITNSTREHGNNLDFLTPDKLHYSAKEYEIWAMKLADAIRMKAF